MKLTLTLNAAEKHVQFILTQNDTMLYAEDFTPKKGGMDLFMLSLQQACQKLGILPADIARIACVVGPGNFMGIRLSIATVSALSRAIPTGILQAPLDYLQCIACNFHGKKGERVRVLTNATSDSVHVNDYIYDNDFFPQALGEIRLISLQEVLTDLTVNYLMGSGVRTHLQTIAPHFSNSILPPHFDNPTSHALWRMTMHAVWQNTDIAPIYLKECDALQSFDHISSLLGNDPHEAREKLHQIMTQAKI